MHHPDHVSVPFGVNPNVCATTQKRQKGETNTSVQNARGLTHSGAITCGTMSSAILTSEDSGLLFQMSVSTVVRMPLCRRTVSTRCVTVLADALVRAAPDGHPNSPTLTVLR